MKMILENNHDVYYFMKNWNTTLKGTVVISAELLSTVLNDYKNTIDSLESTIANLTDENNILYTNFVKEWIDFTIDVVYDNEENPKPESELKKDVIDSIKVELTKFKAEKDYNSIDWGNYNFIGMVLDYGVKSEDVVDKVKKDLAEIEAVPVNAVEEKAVELEGK